MNKIHKDNRGVLIVISGPSGAGKGTICKALLEKHDDIFISVSATTRNPRVGEVDGVNYHFLTKEKIKASLYTTEELSSMLDISRTMLWRYRTGQAKMSFDTAVQIATLLEIDIQGALKVKEKATDGVFIFILPPSMEELKQRIIKRGSETPESLMTRFKSAYKEINYVSKYNYAVVNDNVEDAVKKIEAILLAEKCRVDRLKENLLESKEDEMHEQLYD